MYKRQTPGPNPIGNPDADVLPSGLDPPLGISQWVDLGTVPVPTASDTIPSLVNGNPMDMLNHLHTESSPPYVSGGASGSVAVGNGAVNPPPSQGAVLDKTLAEYVGDSSVTIHIPSGETSSCPNVAWGVSLKKPPRPSLGMGTGLREEVMRRKHADWRYGPPVPPKSRSELRGWGKQKLNDCWRGGFPGGTRQCLSLIHI